MLRKEKKEREEKARSYRSYRGGKNSFRSFGDSRQGFGNYYKDKKFDGDKSVKESDKSKSKDGVKCYNCQGFGHMARDSLAGSAPSLSLGARVGSEEKCGGCNFSFMGNIDRSINIL